MEFEIEDIPINTAGKSSYIGFIIDTLKKLNTDGSNSFFVSCNDYKSPGFLRNSLSPLASKEKIKLSIKSQYKFECEKHSSYTLKRKSPLCSECKLVDQGIRIWRVDKFKNRSKKS